MHDSIERHGNRTKTRNYYRLGMCCLRQLFNEISAKDKKFVIFTISVDPQSEFLTKDILAEIVSGLISCSLWMSYYDILIVNFAFSEINPVARLAQPNPTCGQGFDSLALFWSSVYFAQCRQILYPEVQLLLNQLTFSA